MLVIDDTAVLKKGTRSVGVAPQYCSALGKIANCQTLVSLTLAHGEVPVMARRCDCFLPESWTDDRARLKRAGVPVEYRAAQDKKPGRGCPGGDRSCDCRGGAVWLHSGGGCRLRIVHGSARGLQLANLAGPLAFRATSRCTLLMSR